MAISKQSSKLSLPQENPGVATILEYLILKFPYIEPQVWHQRIADGKVHFDDGSPITTQSRFQAQRRIHYYREVQREPKIPLREKILFRDDHILVAYKPHFLPVTPGGVFVNECLQNRLRRSTGIESLQAMHRLDRVTAGLVLFSVKSNTRHIYHQLFKRREIHKTYQAIAKVKAEDNLEGLEWVVKNRIVKSSPSFRMRVTVGAANSHTVVRCVQQHADHALFELNPVTGKTHQLRLHMQTLGWPILNDKYYPSLQPLSPDNFSAPLQLLAKELRFKDPVTHQLRFFCYEGSLKIR